MDDPPCLSSTSILRPRLNPLTSAQPADLGSTPLSGSTANLVLQDTIERIHVGNMYGDITRGIFLVRGENVVLLGEIVRSDCMNTAPV